jgi:hypothetical protein
MPDLSLRPQTTLPRRGARPLHTAVVLAVVALNAGCDNSGPVAPETKDLRPPEYARTTTPVEFDVQMVFDYSTISQYLSTPDGRRHLDDFPGDLIVTGDLAGTGDIVVSFRVDASFRGHVWADINFTTTAGDWSGKMNGQFVGGPNQAVVNLNLHGPDQQHLKASCIERVSAPDKLDCSGQITRPHG